MAENTKTNVILIQLTPNCIKYLHPKIVVTLTVLVLILIYFKQILFILKKDESRKTRAGVNKTTTEPSKAVK